MCIVISKRKWLKFENQMYQNIFSPFLLLKLNPEIPKDKFYNKLTDI